jgi:hypothetical protein
MSQRSLVLIKPDGVRRGLVGAILRRIEAKGYVLVELQLRTASAELLAEHYAEHVAKPFYPGRLWPPSSKAKNALPDFVPWRAQLTPPRLHRARFVATSAGIGALPCNRI